jgi:hypothetical protein
VLPQDAERIGSLDVGLCSPWWVLWSWVVRFVGFVWAPLGSFGLFFWLAFGCFYAYFRCTQGRLTLLNKTFITYQKKINHSRDFRIS